MSALIVDAFLLSGGSSQRDEDELEQPFKDSGTNNNRVQQHRISVRGYHERGMVIIMNYFLISAWLSS